MNSQSEKLRNYKQQHPDERDYDNGCNDERPYGNRQFHSNRDDVQMRRGRQKYPKKYNNDQLIQGTRQRNQRRDQFDERSQIYPQSQPSQNRGNTYNDGMDQYSQRNQEGNRNPYQNDHDSYEDSIRGSGFKKSDQLRQQGVRQNNYNQFDDKNNRNVHQQQRVMNEERNHNQERDQVRDNYRDKFPRQQNLNDQWRQNEERKSYYQEQQEQSRNEERLSNRKQDINNRQIQKNQSNEILECSVLVNDLEQDEIVKAGKIIREIMRLANGKSNIKLVISDLDKDLLPQIENQFKFGELKLINFQMKEASQNSNILEQSVKEASFREDNEKSLIYNFTNQSNSIEAFQKLLLIYWAHQQEINNKCKKYNVQWKVSLEQNSFIFTTKQDIEGLQAVFIDVSKYLDNLQVIVHFTRSEQEKIIKSRIIRKAEDKLRRLFVNKQWDSKIYHSGEVQQKLEDMKDSAETFNANHFVFFFLKDKELDDVQKIFDDIMDDPTFINKEQIQFRVTYNKSFESESKLKKDIYKLVSVHKNLEIEFQKPQYIKTCWSIDITIIFWIENNQAIELQEQITIRREIEDFLKGKFKIEIKHQRQIDYWESVLCKQFELLGEANNIQVKSSKKTFADQKIGLVITLESNDIDDDFNKFAKDVEYRINNCVKSILKVKLNDPTIDQALRKNPNQLANIYKTFFENLKLQFDKCLVQIPKEQQDERNVFQFIVYAQKDQKLDDISNYIEEKLILELKIKKEKLNFQELLSFTNYKNQSIFEAQLNVLVNVDGIDIIFVGLDRFIKKITLIINQFKTQLIKKYEEKIINLENEYVLNHVIKQLDPVLYPVPPQVIHGGELQLKGDKKFLDEQMNLIMKLKIDIQKKMVKQEIDFTNLEADYLQKHCKHIIDQEVKDNDSILTIEKIPNIQLAQQNSYKDYMNNPNKNINTQISWQWFDKIDYKNFDQSVTTYIESQYQKYLKNPIQNKVFVQHRIDQSPGTHKIDLQSNLITDIALQNTYKLKQQANIYYMDNVPMDQIASNYISLQKQMGLLNFDIFYKKYEVHFLGNGKFKQKNIQTTYERDIRRIEDIKQPLEEILQPDSIRYVLQGLKKRNLEIIEQKLEQLLEDEIVEDDIKLPDLEGEKLETLIQLIFNNSISIAGQLQAKGKLTVTSFPSQIDEIHNIIQYYQDVYPPEWMDQDTNLLKCVLRPNDLEYLKVQQYFQQTCPNIKIHEISRIQNQHLYKNYHKEKNDLIKRYEKKNMVLNNDEKEILVWHGVRGQHPKIIYDSVKDGFDSTYGESYCMWGPGIYFAKNASYSYNYSYTIQKSDNTKYTGKKVILCCKLTTGRLAFLPAQQLRRPPIDFDCVSGNTNGSLVYILYMMDVRRAYPAYEIIFD